MDRLQERFRLLAYRIKCKANNSIQDLYRTLTEKEYSRIVNQKEIRVAGLRRTGNHAIICWMEEQQKSTSNVYHLNNLKVNENPYRYKYQNLSYYHPQHQWAIAQYKKQARGELLQRDCLIYSYEDYSLKQIFSAHFENKHDLYIGKTLQRYDVLIIRDPFNLLASRLKNNFLPVKSKQKSFIDLWIEYAKEYLGETNYLKHNKICVNYNLWVKNRDYRHKLAQKLNIEFTDAGIDKVLSHGGGSSFDGKSLDGKATTMDTSNRWKYFVDNPTYLGLIKNKKILNYSHKIFGFIPGTEILFK